MPKESLGKTIFYFEATGGGSEDDVSVVLESEPDLLTYFGITYFFSPRSIFKRFATSLHPSESESILFALIFGVFKAGFSLSLLSLIAKEGKTVCLFTTSLTIVGATDFCTYIKGGKLIFRDIYLFYVSATESVTVFSSTILGVST